MIGHGGWPAVGLAAVQVMGLGSLYAWSVLIEPVQAQFGTGRTVTGLVFSISIAVFTLSVMAGPRLCAGWRLSSAGAVACALGATGLAGAAMAPAFAVFVLAYGGVFAAASGLGYAADLQMAVTSGVTRSGLATGMIVSAFALGAVALGPVMGQIGASGTLVTALLLPAGLLAATAVLSLMLDRGRAHITAVFPARAAAPDPRGRGTMGPGRGLILLLWSGFATGAAGGLMVLGHAAGIVAEHGGSVTLAGLTVSLIAAGNAIGRLGSGAIADRLGARAILVSAGLVMGLSTGLLSLQPGTGTTAMALVAAGGAYGVMATGYPVAVHHQFGAQRFSAVYGRVFTAWGAAGLVAPFLAGWIFDRTGTYQLALQLATVSAALSALIALGLSGEAKNTSRIKASGDE